MKPLALSHRGRFEELSAEVQAVYLAAAREMLAADLSRVPDPEVTPEEFSEAVRKAAVETYYEDAAQHGRRHS